MSQLCIIKLSVMKWKGGERLKGEGLNFTTISLLMEISQDDVFKAISAVMQVKE